MLKNKGVLAVLILVLIGIAVNAIYLLNDKVELNLYFHPDKLGFTTRAIEAFEEENPGIRINLVELPDNTNEKYEIISNALALQNGDIDIIDADVTWPAIFVNAGWIAPLESYFTQEELDTLLASAVDAGTINGQLYGIPYRIDSGMLYYRKDLLEKYNKPIPKTWDELIETSTYIMDREPDTYGLAGSWFEFEGLTCNYLEFLWAYDGKVLDEDLTLALNSPEAVTALEKMTGMIYDSGIAPPDITTYKSGDVRKMFMNANLIFMRDWPTGWRKADGDDSLVKGNVGVAPLPSGRPDGTSHGTYGGWLFMVAEQSNHKEEATKFIKFMVSKEMEKDMVLTHYYMPSEKSLYSDPDVLEIMPFLTDMLPFLNAAKPRPRVSHYDKISYILQDEVTNALTGQKEPKDAIEDAHQRILK